MGSSIRLYVGSERYGMGGINAEGDKLYGGAFIR